MSRVCMYCGKGPQFGHSIRHAHSVQWALRAPKKQKIWRPNLQSAKIVQDGFVVKVRVCAKCLKAGKVVRPSVTSAL